MSNFPAPLGNLPSGGKTRIFNDTKKPDNRSPLERYADKNTSDEERKVIFEQERDRAERERLAARMFIC